MKMGHWLILSLCSNALLAGLLLRQGFGNTPPAPYSSEITNRTLRILPEQLKAESNPPQESSNAIPYFHWSQLESEDYRIYAANLRAIGCPEATVRDIILADVNDLFGRRVKELVAPLQNRFWDLLAHQEQLRKVVEEKEKEFNALTPQRTAMLVELLGKEDYRSEE